MRTLPEHLSSPLVCSGISVARSLVFCVVFCRSLFVFLSLFFWPLYCLFFFDLRILITSLVSSKMFLFIFVYMRLCIIAQSNMGLYCSIFSFLCNVLKTAHCLFIFFVLEHPRSFRNSITMPNVYPLNDLIL